MQDLRLQTGVYNNNNNSYNNNNIIIIVPKIDIINFSRYVSSLNSNDHERRYSNTDCSRLPSAGGRLRSSSTHSRRRRCRRLFRGGGGGGAKVPHRRGGAYGPGRVIRLYTRADARGAFATTADRVDPPFKVPAKTVILFCMTRIPFYPYGFY